MRTLFEWCSLWVSRGPVNACVDWLWTREFVAIPD
jgi:hypothetical protein